MVGVNHLIELEEHSSTIGSDYDQPSAFNELFEHQAVATSNKPCPFICLLFQ